MRIIRKSLVFPWIVYTIGLARAANSTIRWYADELHTRIVMRRAMRLARDAPDGMVVWVKLNRRHLNLANVRK